jgi:hypothetical protein
MWGHASGTGAATERLISAGVGVVGLAHAVNAIDHHSYDLITARARASQPSI